MSETNVQITSLGTFDGIEPVLLSGVYRSGTTLLSRILNNHPKYFITYDSVKYLRFCLDRFNPIKQPGKYEALVRETGLRLGKRWSMKLDTHKIIDSLHGQSVTHALVYHTIMSDLRDKQKPTATHWGEKTNLVWSSIPHFLSMFPKGKVVHIDRDPRDVTASYKKMTVESGYSYLDAPFNCLHAMTSLREYVDSFGSDRILLVKLEDLVTDPAAEAQKICSFLDIEFLKQMTDAEQFVDKAGDRWQSNTAFGASGNGISNDTQRWQHNLSAAEVVFIELIAFPVLAEYGYEPSGIMPDKSQWREIHNFISDPIVHGRFKHWLESREGVEAYPSDPVSRELQIVQGS